MTTRRTFLAHSSLAAAAALGTPWRLSAEELSNLGLIAPPPPRRSSHRGDPDLKALAQRALDAATAAGASYADVRFTRIKKRMFPNAGITVLRNSETLSVGVRALSRGAWGFMADTELTPDVMDWLGRSAASLGKMSAWRNRPPIELGERPPVAVGHWEMPVKRDPFTVSDAEFKEVLGQVWAAINSQAAFVDFNFERHERTFASTDGSYTTQILYNSFSDTIDGESKLQLAYFKVPMARPSGVGFEVLTETIIPNIPQWRKEYIEGSGETKDIDPGRFDVVFDASAMAALVSTMGIALQADRAAGYEANADGTSFLGPPETILGTTQFPSALTISANRSLVGGAATVRWDDEGVVPQDFSLIKDGVVVDYATNRQLVSELAAGYQKRGLSIRSRGCAGAESALCPPMIQTPNLRLHPGPKDLSFEELVAGIDDGVAILGGTPRMDQQQLTATGTGDMAYRIKKGKIDMLIPGPHYMFRVPDLWKNLVALGGERSAMTRGFTVQKGQPEQSSVHSVQAVAARFKNVTIRPARTYMMNGYKIQD